MYRVNVRVKNICKQVTNDKHYTNDINIFKKNKCCEHKMTK